MTAKIAIENVNHPNSKQFVDRAKYDAIRQAMIDALSERPNGVAFDALTRLLLRSAPAALFPGGAKVAWYAKAVQLDLEAKKVIARTSDRPMRLRMAR